MRTYSIDLVAYLHLAGIEPDEVNDHRETFRKREFIYKRTPLLGPAIRAFDANAMVPVKAFAEARARVKTYRNKKAVAYFNAAIDDAKQQVGIARSLDAEHGTLAERKHGS
jgi:hypothetical protein